jgi:dienelactone hydrolase
MTRHPLPERSTRLRTMTGAILALTVLVALLSGCTPAPQPKRYVDKVFASSTKTGGVTFATAPDLITGAPTTLKLDYWQPAGDTLTKRPLIVWVHGGGFRGGTRSNLDTVAAEWARRGYVTMSIDYRLDPENRCQAVQDGKITDPNVLIREHQRCKKAILTAQEDTHAAIRWARANATRLKIDPNKVAVGGFSAGAVTAVNVAQRAETPGTVGDNDSQSPRVKAALAASGCNFETTTIGAGDAPIHIAASQLDSAVAFRCVTSTIDTTAAKGLVEGHRYYFGEGTHALSLYLKYQTELDAAWSTFLVRHLGL